MLCVKVDSIGRTMKSSSGVPEKRALLRASWLPAGARWQKYYVYIDLRVPCRNLCRSSTYTYWHSQREEFREGVTSSSWCDLATIQAKFKHLHEYHTDITSRRRIRVDQWIHLQVDWHGPSIDQLEVWFFRCLLVRDRIGCIRNFSWDYSI
jgi:hypothetical protein